ncbi:putative dual-specificity kinase TKL-Pl-4 family [Medicago truncatula]|uniref:Putative dual-specificity kinase TKL-Pl-4 family n=1 Tax=Medicago truncatula TaxID=3880 RepID=A0A396HRZ1_MEDTR|nr:putative dual-specificity kinase TKL-Pl-4 family [Medicago truncatula]
MLEYENCPVAIKVILPEKTNDATPEECKASFQKEVNLLSRIQHENVIKFIGASVEPMMIITELLEGGSLYKNMKRIHPITFSLEQCLSYALDISQAMEYLHANGIIHRDLKPDNLLLTKNNDHVKVADLGLARENICNLMTSEIGTYRYMAPELTGIDLPRGAKICYDHKADVYSFAITLWSLIKNETPFKEKQGIIAAYGARRNIRPSLAEFPEEIITLLESCWDKNPKLRPEFKEITEILISILFDLYTAKINALASIKPICTDRVDFEIEEESSNVQHTTASLVSTVENETLGPDGGAEAVNSLILDESRDQSGSQAESQSGTQTPFHDLVEKKPKQKSKMKHLFSYFLGCIAF